MATEIMFGEFRTHIDGNMLRSVKFPAFAHLLQIPHPVVPTVDATATPQECPFVGHGGNDCQAKKPARKLLSWIPPQRAWIKLNCDGAMSRGRAGCGYVLRDEARRILGAGYCATRELIVIDTELRGMWEGLKAAVKVSEPGHKIWIEGDCMNLIASFNNMFGSYLHDHPVAKDILRLLPHFSEWRALHIYGEGNQPVDWLAGKGKFSPLPLHWTSHFSCELVMLVQRDLSTCYVGEKKYGN